MYNFWWTRRELNPRLPRCERGIIPLNHWPMRKYAFVGILIIRSQMPIFKNLIQHASVSLFLLAMRTIDMVTCDRHYNLKISKWNNGHFAFIVSCQIAFLPSRLQIWSPQMIKSQSKWILVAFTWEQLIQARFHYGVYPSTIDQAVRKLNQMQLQ